MLKLIFSLSTLWWLILFLYIPACFGLIIIVLLQKGKGQGLAGAFGMGGGMDTIFGPRSSKSLPQKITYASAALFMCLALVMSILSGKVGRASAPELITETPQASLEGLFDATPAVMDPITVPVSDASDTAGAEEAGQQDTASESAPTAMDSLFEVTTETPAPEEAAANVQDPAEAAPVEEAAADVQDPTEAAPVEEASEAVVSEEVAPAEEAAVPVAPVADVEVKDDTHEEEAVEVPAEDAPAE